jgi:hypothetical protein
MSHQNVEVVQRMAAFLAGGRAESPARSFYANRAEALEAVGLQE